MKDTHRVERGDRRAVLLRHRVRALALVSAMAALAPITAMASVSGAEAPPAGPGYLTIQFGRSIEGSYLGKGCVRAPGFLTLAEVAADLQTRGSARRPRWWSIAQVRPPSVAKAVTSTRVGLIFKLLRRTAGHSSAMG